MKISTLVLVLLMGAVIAIPAMAEKIELTDHELAQISAQGWGPDASSAPNAITETAKTLTESSKFAQSSVPAGSHGMELILAPTTITIDSITSETPYGTFAMGDIAMRVTAKVTVTY